MLTLLSEIFSYSFLVRALIVGSLVALCAALLGVSLVLKRYSMIGDGLSHVGFGALSIAMAMNAAPLAVAIPVVIIAAFLLLRISQNSRLGGDSAGQRQVQTFFNLYFHIFSIESIVSMSRRQLMRPAGPKAPERHRHGILSRPRPLRIIVQR